MDRQKPLRKQTSRAAALAWAALTILSACGPTAADEADERELAPEDQDPNGEEADELDVQSASLTASTVLRITRTARAFGPTPSASDDYTVTIPHGGQIILKAEAQGQGGNAEAVLYRGTAYVGAVTASTAGPALFSRTFDVSAGTYRVVMRASSSRGYGGAEARFYWPD